MKLAEFGNIWEFNYHRGSAMLVGHVLAGDEGKAMLVAQAWCAGLGFRGPASVRPFIAADETILGASPGTMESVPLPSPVEATTDVQTFGSKVISALTGR